MGFEYYKILISLIIVIVIALALFLLSYLTVPRTYDGEKLSIYECGFNPFSDTRTQFEVRFYLVAILFIIFDLEITFLFPWCVSLFALDFFGWISMFLFLTLLTVGFVFEWLKGALDWE